MVSDLVLPARATVSELAAFGERIVEEIDAVGFKFSARGWGYYFEGLRAIDKDDIDAVQNLINRCRKLGFMPVDALADEEARQFSGVEMPNAESPVVYMREWLEGAMRAEEYYTPDWWDGEEYYIQMVVEKIDLVSLFEPITRKYHIPIASSKGWASILMRAKYSRRFKEAEKKGLKCVLLYCGDFDPDGLRIGKFLRKNLRDVANITWGDGETGYDPDGLIVDRFGLNYDFIVDNDLTWIDNLITGSGRDLGSPSHPNHGMPYVQDYIAQYGARKVEANAITKPNAIPAAQALCRDAIEKYIGKNALSRFEKKRQRIRNVLKRFRKRTKLDKAIADAIKKINKEE